MISPIQFLSLNPLLLLMTFTCVNLQGILLILWRRKRFDCSVFVVDKLREQNCRKIKSLKNHIPKFYFFIIFGTKSRMTISKPL